MDSALCVLKNSTVNTKEANTILKVPWRHKGRSWETPGRVSQELSSTMAVSHVGSATTCG